ncbi:hypothetical protein CMQ_2661 [Grosmannia clavigera kw1407]|uniref:Uncharacterized protein n=1 Tax=Grosmannia clavigera (strain kw1407 / UAMH 11150) TaxID=655863 RepID=F0XH97_GROCL|nr:uncharacterized protein CMQ_2661 [Grosmannia clavigera kw1407]EFX02732.1 hypothetical protein CMQ_2661 [Grosmannia clavigera kw1407]
MAATPFDAANAAVALTSNSNPSFAFDVYDDARSAGNGRTSYGLSPALPTGSCNFVDLTHGSSGPQCGCRRFWSRSNAAATSMANSFGTSVGPINNGALDLSQAGWCMCSHHACFHDQAPQQVLPNGNIPTDQSVVARGAAISGATTGFPGLSASLSAPLHGQKNERPRAKREPLSPLQESVALQMLAEQDVGRAGKIANNNGLLSFGLQPAKLSSYTERLFAGIFEDVAPLDEQAMVSCSAADKVVPAPSSIDTSIATSVAGYTPYSNSIPDTLRCGHYDPPPRSMFPSQQGVDGCLMPSSQAPPSTASSISQRRYLRPFAGKGLKTLTHTQSLPPLKPQPPSEPEPREFTDATHDSEQDTSSTQPGLQSLVGAVQAHEQRLDKLENVSFSVPSGQEDWSDRHDHMDMRVTELESRVDEVEKRLTSNDETASGVDGSIGFSRRRLLGRDDDATTVSAVSMAATDVTTSMTSSSSGIIGESDVRSQIQALQAQVSFLQTSALPTYNSLWELEVVFLPFPLKGVWVEASQFPTTAAVAAAAAAQRRQSGGYRYQPGQSEDDEWTQMPNTLSRQTPDAQSPSLEGNALWTSDWPDYSATSDAPRLLPRACAPGRVIDNRLRSCGLVQTLSVRGTDARSLKLAMATAFGSVFRAMAQGASSERRAERSKVGKGDTSGSVSSVPSPEELQARFLGLQQPWVPLRKIHKDSRLRFLTCAEMLTPTLWDAPFLTSSVVMKATGRHRLYVTHPDAYMQDRHAYRCGWSWQRLRQISVTAATMAPGSSSSSKAPAVGAADSCWSWDSRLDEPPSAPQSSLSSVHHRPSPSPFSREGTPTDGTFARPRSRTPSRLVAAASANSNADNGFSRSHRSTGTSGSTQFFAAAQSPLPTGPWAGSTARRSPSPFLFSLVPQVAQTAASSQLMSSSTRTRRPAPTRTVSMTAPPSHSGHPVIPAGNLSSPATVSRKRGHSISERHISAPPSPQQPQQRHRQHTTVSTMAYDRHPSPLASASRPSPRLAPLPSPVTNTNTANSATNTVAAPSVSKRRRSTRSPSGFWPRHTPQRSMSRSPSVIPAQVPMWVADHTRDGAPSAAEHERLNQQHVPSYQHVRGATPLCYATPHSNAPTMDVPLPASLRRRQGSTFQAEAEQVDNDGTICDGYDHDMLCDDNDDFPMTQDDEGDGEDYDGNVFEDEADELDDIGDVGTITDGYYNQSGQLPPEDQPWPGFEDDEDAHMSDSENMNPFSGEEGSQEQQQQRLGPDGDSQATSQQSDSSSRPSEYPSTHPAWPVAAVPPTTAIAAAAAAASIETSTDAGARGGQLQGREQQTRRHSGQGMWHDGGHLQQRRNTDADSGIGFVIHEDTVNGR